jgi:thiol-disulfide isomerase/thioredoxin
VSKGPGRGRRIASLVAALIALQVALVLIYREIERRRHAAPAATSLAATAPIEHDRLDGAAPAPALAARRADGTVVDLAAVRGRPVLVHFWATWCAPCRDELPTLLATDDALGGQVTVLAIATDEDWDTVRHFFAGDIPPAIALGPRSHRAYGVTGLPATFLVSPTGHLLARIDGARTWSAAGVRQLLAP